MTDFLFVLNTFIIIALFLIYIIPAAPGTAVGLAVAFFAFTLYGIVVGQRISS